MKLVHRILWRDADGAYKQLGLALDDNVNQLGKISLCVVVLRAA